MHKLFLTLCLLFSLSTPVTAQVKFRAVPFLTGPCAHDFTVRPSVGHDIAEVFYFVETRPDGIQYGMPAQLQQRMWNTQTVTFYSYSDFEFTVDVIAICWLPLI